MKTVVISIGSLLGMLLTSGLAMADNPLLAPISHLQGTADEILSKVDQCLVDDHHAGARSDFALFDGSNPDNGATAGAVCYVLQDGTTSTPAIGTSFTYHVAVSNWGSDGVVRLTYADGDIVRFPIKAGDTITLSQAAGSNEHDKAIRLSNEGSAAQLAGVMSASSKGQVVCLSCDAGSSGDSGCDAIVAN